MRDRPTAGARLRVVQMRATPRGEGDRGNLHGSRCREVPSGERSEPKPSRPLRRRGFGRGGGGGGYGAGARGGRGSRGRDWMGTPPVLASVVVGGGRPQRPPRQRFARALAARLRRSLSSTTAVGGRAAALLRRTIHHLDNAVSVRRVSRLLVSPGASRGAQPAGRAPAVCRRAFRIKNGDGIRTCPRPPSQPGRARRARRAASALLVDEPPIT